jgi:DNA repair protein RadC
MEVIKEVVRIKQVVEERSGVVAEHIRSPESAYKIAIHFIGDEDREVFFVIGLNNKNQVNCVNRCHVGSINASIVHPREVFKVLILNNCASFVIAHNHPSYELTPSNEDRQVTERIAECGKMLGIELIDHLIVNENSYYSFKEKGLL